MLSRKQVWRKTSRTRRSNHYLLSFLFNDNIWNLLERNSSYTSTTVSSSLNDVNSIQFPELESSSSSSSNSTSENESSSNTIANNNNNIKTIRKRKVTFSNLVKVCLIPTRQEMIHLAGDMYWTCAECDIFKKEAFQEIQAYSSFMDCTCKEAILLLFQPGNHTLNGKEVPELDLDTTSIPSSPRVIHRSSTSTSDLYLSSRMEEALQLNPSSFVIEVKEAT